MAADARGAFRRLNESCTTRPGPVHLSWPGARNEPRDFTDCSATLDMNTRRGRPSPPTPGSSTNAGLHRAAISTARPANSAHSNLPDHHSKKRQEAMRKTDDTLAARTEKWFSHRKMRSTSHHTFPILSTCPHSHLLSRRTDKSSSHIFVSGNFSPTASSAEMFLLHRLPTVRLLGSCIRMFFLLLSLSLSLLLSKHSTIHVRILSQTNARATLHTVMSSFPNFLPNKSATASTEMFVPRGTISC